MTEHTEHMKTALAEASRGRGLVEPNPQVGAVIVKDGHIVSTGYHEKFGGPHAEIEAIKAAGPGAKGSSLYVTLEPCAHHGKTPPCVDAILEAGITRVICAMKDPNPLTSGKGYEKLQSAGISVTEGILNEESTRLNAPYIKLITKKMPYVTAKWAMTLDKETTTPEGESKWISCEESRERVHKLRGFMDAILVGIETVLADDPLLTAREYGPRIPMRIVADSRARTPANCKLLQTLDEGDVLIAASADAPEENLNTLRNAGAKVFTTSEPGRVNLKELLLHLGSMQMTNLLVEGGNTILNALFEESLVDAAKIFIAPKTFGGTYTPLKILPKKEIIIQPSGQDILVEGLM